MRDGTRTPTGRDLHAAVTDLEGRLDLAFAQLEGRIDRLDSKLNLVLIVMALAVLASAADHLLVG